MRVNAPLWRFWSAGAAKTDVVKTAAERMFLRGAIAKEDRQLDFVVRLFNLVGENKLTHD